MSVEMCLVIEDKAFSREMIFEMETKDQYMLLSFVDNYTDLTFIESSAKNELLESTILKLKSLL